MGPLHIKTAVGIEGSGGEASAMDTVPSTYTGPTSLEQLLQSCCIR